VSSIAGSRTTVANHGDLHKGFAATGNQVAAAGQIAMATDRRALDSHAPSRAVGRAKVESGLSPSDAPEPRFDALLVPDTPTNAC
jgi:hypothetical protein